MRARGLKVSPRTWARWESGHQRPPRKKIDAVADVLGTKRNGARRRAGYPLHLQARLRKRRTGLIAMMLHELSHDTSVNSRVLRLYALVNASFEKTDPRVNIERITQIAEVFDELNDLTYEQRAEAWERVKRVLAEAQDLPPFTRAPENATMILPKDIWPQVFLGAHVQVNVEYRDSGERVMWYGYDVKDLKEKMGKTVAKLKCIGVSIE